MYPKRAKTLQNNPVRMSILGSDNVWTAPAPGLSPVSSTPCQSIQRKELLFPKCVEFTFHPLSHSKSSSMGRKDCQSETYSTGLCEFCRRLSSARCNLNSAERAPHHHHHPRTHCPTGWHQGWNRWRPSFNSSIVTGRSLLIHINTLLEQSYIKPIVPKKVNHWLIPK